MSQPQATAVVNQEEAEQVLTTMSEGGGNRYNLFGGVLGTDLDVPELHEAPAGVPPTWTLTVHRDRSAPSLGQPVLATDDIASAAHVALQCAPDGMVRLAYTDTGTFDIGPDGSRIDWYCGSHVDESLARTDLLGRVMAIAAHRSGILTLHASAVAIDDRIVGFMAPKFHGKSTLACAMADAGASLVTDDALAIRQEAFIAGAPGVPAVRLRHESARYLRRIEALVPDDTGEWRHTERLAEEFVAKDWMRVDALYVLAPVRADVAQAERVPIPSIPAAMTFVQHAKLGALLAGPLAVEYLERATCMVSQVPVFALRYPRDLSRLGELTRQVFAWHRQ